MRSYDFWAFRDKITASGLQDGTDEEVVNMKVRITIEKQGRPPTVVEGTVVAWSQGVERFGGPEFLQVPVCVISTAAGIRCVPLRQYGAAVDVAHLDHATQGAIAA